MVPEHDRISVPKRPTAELAEGWSVVHSTAGSGAVVPNS